MKKILALQSLASSEAPEAMYSTSSIGCKPQDIAAETTCSIDC